MKLRNEKITIKSLQFRLPKGTAHLGLLSCDLPTKAGWLAWSWAMPAKTPLTLWVGRDGGQRRPDQVQVGRTNWETQDGDRRDG